MQLQFCVETFKNSLTRASSSFLDDNDVDGYGEIVKIYRNLSPTSFRVGILLRRRWQPAFFSKIRTE